MTVVAEVDQLFRLQQPTLITVEGAGHGLDEAVSMQFQAR
jgi:hypothetical protein